MKECNADHTADKMPDRPIFSVELFPHRSLPRKGFRIVLGIFGAVWLFYGALFALEGAWPVGLGFAIAFVILYFAFRLNYRSGRVREEVTVSRTDVAIRKYSPSGRMVEHRFNPFWTRFQVSRHDEIGITSMHISGQGQETEVGAFLNPKDRESFADAFKRALATVTQRI